MEKKSKIYVAGHRGLLGSAIVRVLEAKGFSNLIVRTRDELELLDQKQVSVFFQKEKPDYVFMAAAKVGGIMANSTQPAQFIYQNLTVQTNMIESAHKNGVKKLLFLGSSCIYPRLAPQPIKEESFMTGPLEPTNRAYAVAKIAGIVMCQSYREEYGDNFISAMPTNMYGPNDNFDLENSHVLPALIRKFHDAKTANKKEITLWGTGVAQREFLFVNDCADACLFLMEHYDSGEIINISAGKNVTIKELAHLIKKTVDFKGEILWDKTRPDGMPQKRLDLEKINHLGWKSSVTLDEGLKKTYAWFKNNPAKK